MTTRKATTNGSGRLAGVLLIATGLLANERLIGLLADGGISSPLYRLLIAAFEVVVVGLGIFLVYRRPRLPWAEMATGLAALAVAAVAAELLLAWSGYRPLRAWPGPVPELAPWWNDDAGRLHAVPGQMPDRDEAARHNAEGYRDTDELDRAANARRRVLLLGDSFAYGASAWGEGESFPEILQEETGAVVWNTGIPGHGQRDQLLVLRRYLPLIRPQVVVLAFYMNDFFDNVYPAGRMAVYSDGSWVLRYALDGDGKPRRLSAKEAYRRAFPAAERWGEIVLTSRVASLVARGLMRAEERRAAGGRAAAPRAMVADEAMITSTGELLREMSQRVNDAGARFLVLLVPSREAVASPSSNYRAALGLCGELALDCLEVRGELRWSDYDGEHPLDSHWTPAGHRQAGLALAARVDPLLTEIP